MLCVARCPEAASEGSLDSRGSPSLFGVRLSMRKTIYLLLFLLVSCGTKDEPAQGRTTDNTQTSLPAPSVRDGRGTAVVRPSDPVPARSRGTWEFTFTVGEGGIPSGGGIAFQVSPFWGWSPPQVFQEDAPGYCTVQTSSSVADLDVGCDLSRHYLLASVRHGALREGDTLTITYGDTQGGANASAAATVDSYAERRQEFLFKTDADGDGIFGEIKNQPGLCISPREAVQLWVNAPSLVKPGELFEISVAALDGMGNRATSYRCTMWLASHPGGALLPPQCALGPDERGAKRVQAQIDQPGLYVVTADVPEDALSAVSNPILCGGGTSFSRVYWGDIHGHTALSDGTGHPEDYYAYARDVAGLDVAAITDHDAFGLRPLHGDPWRLCMVAARRFREPGRFVTLLGYEWTSWKFGHRNVYFPGDDGAVYSYSEEATSTPEGLWAAIRPWGAITIPHHTGGGPIATDWDHIPPPDIEMLAEVFSIHGNSEYYGSRRMIYSPVEGHFVQDALARGYRLGLLASGDGHICHPGRWTNDYSQGLAAFQADTLTREAIWESLTSRRVYGTSGARILLEFRLNGYPMGAAIPDDLIPSVRVGRVTVLGTAQLAMVQVVKNGQELQTFSCTGLLEEFTFRDSSRGRRGDFYYVRVIQADGHMAWSSPVWLGGE